MAKGARAYFRRTNLLTSVMLVFPLFLIYQVGVLAVPEVHNGADLVTNELLHLMNGHLGSYVLLNLAFGLCFVVAVLLMRRKNEFDPRLFVPVMIESSVYALFMGSIILFVMQDILHVPPGLALAPAAAGAVGDVGILGKIVLAFGAGVHEELLFRLIMITGLVAFCEKLLGWKRGASVALAFFVSSALFSAAHHVIGGEPWRIGVFTYRLLCGLIFATLFYVRGFAVAVYTHALYDVFVLVLHG